jgi:hypothetical protein
VRRQWAAAPGKHSNANSHRRPQLCCRCAFTSVNNSNHFGASAQRERQRERDWSTTQRKTEERVRAGGTRAESAEGLAEAQSYNSPTMEEYRPRNSPVSIRAPHCGRPPSVVLSCLDAANAVRSSMDACDVDGTQRRIQLRQYVHFEVETFSRQIPNVNPNLGVRKV